jgi:hypothetical protein
MIIALWTASVHWTKRRIFLLYVLLISFFRLLPESHDCALSTYISVAAFYTHYAEYSENYKANETGYKGRLRDRCTANKMIMDDSLLFCEGSRSSSANACLQNETRWNCVRDTTASCMPVSSKASYVKDEWMRLPISAMQTSVAWGNELRGLNLGCLHPVACVRSGDKGSYIRLRNVTIVG